MRTISEAAAAIAGVVAHPALSAGVTGSQLTSVSAIATEWEREMRLAFEVGTLSVRHKSTLTLIDPRQEGAVVAFVLSGVIADSEINRWLKSHGLPIEIKPEAKPESIRAVVPGVDEGSDVGPDPTLPWHLDPYWRRIIHQAADTVAHRKMAAGERCSAHAVAPAVARLLEQYQGFPRVGGETIRKRALNAQKDFDLPGWTFRINAPSARAAPSSTELNSPTPGPGWPVGPATAKK